MSAGRYRHSVTFQRATVAQNAVGDPVSTWSDLAATRASIEPTAGKERYTAMQVQGETTVRIVCRYQSALSDLAVNDRMVHGSTIYDIKSVMNLHERNRQLEVFAKVHI